jgi:hypothetical protein
MSGKYVVRIYFKWKTPSFIEAITSTLLNQIWMIQKPTTTLRDELKISFNVHQQLNEVMMSFSFDTLSVLL